MKKLFLVIFAVTILSSCNQPLNSKSDSINTETSSELAITDNPATPSLEPTISPTETMAFPGQVYNENGISLVVPECMGNSISGRIVPEKVPCSDEGPGRYSDCNPEYRQIVLTNYPLTEKLWEPTISVYPIDDYDLLIGSGLVRNWATGIQWIVANNQPPTDQIYPFHNVPMLPFVSLGEMVSAQGSIIKFQNGGGGGFLLDLSEDYAPVNNYELFYTFQGVTEDGKYWISAILPVNVPYLQDTPTSGTVPADGIAMPTNVTEEELITNYYTPLVIKLDDTPEDMFTPSLSCIISFIETLNITY